jgi:hypothetical protein
MQQNVKWKELYASESLNLKTSGILPAGVYHGFVVTPGNGMVLNVDPNLSDHPYSVAIVNRDGYNITITSSETENFTVPDGTSGTYYLCIEAQYILGGGGDQDFVLLESAALQPYHVILATLVIPGGATTITSEMITTTNKTLPKGMVFDESEILASRSFVQRAIGNKAASFGINSTATLSAIHAGCEIQLANTGPYTITLPLVSELHDGATIMLSCSASGDITIQRQGTDQIHPAMGGGITSFTMNSGDTTVLSVINGTYGLVGGSVLFKYHPQFKNVLGDSGYQKFPGGMILQWGITPPSSSSVGVSSTFAMQFPNACKNITFGASGSSNGFMVSLESYSTTGFVSSVYSSTSTRAANVQVHYQAIGY